MRSNGQNDINHQNENSPPISVFGTSSSQSENGQAQVDDSINDRPYDHTNLEIGATATTLSYEATTHVAFLKIET